MKKFIIIIALMLSCADMVAQDENSGRFYRHEIAVGTGYLSFATIAYSHYWGVWNWDEGLEASHPIPIPVSVHYFYHLNKNWALGATAHYEQYGRREFYFGFMPQAKWSWLHRKNVSLYSRVAAGAMYTYYINDDNRFVPDFQFSPFGIEVGRMHWRGFIDIGVGTQDFVQGGVIYRF